MIKFDPAAEKVVAQAIANDMGASHGDWDWEDSMGTAFSALLAYHAYLITNGLKISPIEPTQDMQYAGNTLMGYRPDDGLAARAIYKTMNAAWREGQ